MTCFLIRDDHLLPKKELHRSLQVETQCSKCRTPFSRKAGPNDPGLHLRMSFKRCQGPWAPNPRPPPLSIGSRLNCFSVPRTLDVRSFWPGFKVLGPRVFHRAEGHAIPRNTPLCCNPAFWFGAVQLLAQNLFCEFDSCHFSM